MKKRILLSMMVISIVSGMLTAGTMSYFSDTETMTGLTFSTGNANLKMTQCNMHQWYDGDATAAELGVSLPENIYPGYEGTWNDPDGCIYLGNFGTVDLNITAIVTGYTQDVSVWDTIQMKLAWDGNADGTGFHTLHWWTTHHAKIFDSPLGHDHSSGYQGYAKYVYIMLKVPTSAGDEIANAHVSFNIEFDAIQAHQKQMNETSGFILFLPIFSFFRKLKNIQQVTQNIVL